MQGRYRILERVAAGAMGVVYRGERVELGRPVAVKFLHPWIAAQQAFRTRFETEARAMSRLNHPNCVSVIDFGFEGSPYVVMDFVTGGTLRKVLEWGRLSPARAVAIMRQLLAGVAHAHGQGIIHRDLKPDNMILTDTDGLPDHVKILDFGLAKLRDGPAMTSGLAIGTPSYMSPEQTGAPGEIDGRTDIYALGVVLYEMLAGAKPFSSDKVADILLMHRDVAPKPLRQVVPAAGISEALEKVVLRALEKKAEDRFQNATAFAAALDEVPEASLRVPVPARAGSPGASAGAASIADGDKTIADHPGLVLADDVAGALAAAKEPSAPVAAVVAPSVSTGSGSGMKRWLSFAAMALAAIALVFVGLWHRPKQRPAAGPPPSGAQQPAPSVAVAAAPAPLVPPPLAIPAPTPAPSKAATAAAPATPSVEDRRAEAAKLVTAGDWEQALALLQKAEHEHPENGAVAADLANVALEHKRWGEGAQAARQAGQRDPQWRGDERLVKNLIHTLSSDKGYEKTEDVLHGFGAPAVPFLKKAAAHDKNPMVRERAAEILHERGNSRGSSRSTFNRPPPPRKASSSNHSIFTR
ncbi:MAG TPA: protein kinase [Polyangia bacterium]